MAKIRVKLNGRGVADLMKSEAIQEILVEKANAVRDICGEGYEVTTHVGKNRANASVKAVTSKAKRDNLKNNTLVKAVKAVR